MRTLPEPTPAPEDPSEVPDAAEELPEEPATIVIPMTPEEPPTVQPPQPTEPEPQTPQQPAEPQTPPAPTDDDDGDGFAPQKTRKSSGYDGSQPDGNKPKGKPIYKYSKKNTTFKKK